MHLGWSKELEGVPEVEGLRGGKKRGDEKKKKKRAASDDSEEGESVDPAEGHGKKDKAKAFASFLGDQSDSSE